MPELTVKMEEFESYHALEEEDKALVEEALAKLPHAHAPYSRFHVAAALRTSSGKCWVGTNQENASYPVGICAERVALGISSNLSPGEAVTALAIVYADRGTPGHHPLAPCGGYPRDRKSVRNVLHFTGGITRLFCGTYDYFLAFCPKHPPTPLDETQVLKIFSI